MLSDGLARVDGRMRTVSVVIILTFLFSPLIFILLAQPAIEVAIEWVMSLSIILALIKVDP